MCEHNNIMIHKQEYSAEGKILNQQRTYPEGTKFQYYLICTDCVNIVDEITEEQVKFLKQVKFLTSYEEPEYE